MSEHKISSRDDYSTESWKLFFTIFFKTTALSFVFVLIFLIITVIGVGAIFHAKLSKFEQLTQTSRTELFEMIKTGLNEEPENVNNTITFLVLGIDTLANRGDVQPLTDTMLLATVHLDTGEIHLLSIPRDLWSKDYKTKVNALYSYGEEHHPGEPEKFTLQVVENMTGLKVQHTVVISLDTLAQLIDTVGGITVDVPTSFRDDMFPRTDVDVTVERDPTKLYKTIEFRAGQQEMNGETALEYIRSRHSVDTEGTDTARSSRQQLVIRSIIQKLLSPSTLKSPETIAKLYMLYQQQFGTFIPLSKLVSITKKMYPVRNALSFHSEVISIYPDDPAGVLVHPPERQYDNQWVYVEKDTSAFKQEVQTKLLQNEVNQVQYRQQ